MTILGNSATPAQTDGGGDNGFLITCGITGNPGGSVLSTPGTIISISIYVFSTAAGNILLGLYDNTGASGQAGTLIASCPSTALVNGWNTINVSSQVLVPAGTYWLAFTPSSGVPVFASDSVAAFVRYIGGQAFTMPSTAPTLASTTTQNYGIYATLVDSSTTILLGQEVL